MGMLAPACCTHCLLLLLLLLLTVTLEVHCVAGPVLSWQTANG
jgi:hypothetical protein